MKTTLVFLFAVLFAADTFSQDLYNPEYSVYMALQYTGELRVGQEVVDQITSDRTLIEGSFPVVSQLAQYEEWSPGLVLVRLTDDGWSDFMAGGFQALRDLASETGCFVVDTNYIIKTLEYSSLEPFHSGVMAGLFSGLEGVRYSMPSFLGLGGSRIEVLELGQESRYLYTKAWNCSPMGCASEHHWEVTVSGAEVLSVVESGAVPTASTFWGSMKALYR
jgi:hypothetical protein